MKKDPRGRHPVSDAEKKDILQRIKPYLKTGLSVRKALHITGINNSKFYRCMERDEHFRDEVERFRQYLSVHANAALVGDLQGIIKRQVERPLDKKDVNFLKWFALNSKMTTEEYGRRTTFSSCDPNEEIQRLKAMLSES